MDDRCGGRPRSSSRSALRPDRDHRAHGVEEVRQQQREDQQHQRQEQVEVEAAGERGTEGPEHVHVPDQTEIGQRHDLVDLGHVERPAGGVVGGLRPDAGGQLDQHGDDGGADDGDQQRTLDPLGVQDRRPEQAEHEDQQRPADDRAVDAELDRRRTGRLADEARVEQPDEGDEQADADRDAHPQGPRHRLEHRGPEAGQHQQGDQHPFDHDQPHRLRPGHLRRDGEGQQRVQPEPGGDADREPADDAHQDGHHPGDQRGRGGDHGDGLVDVGADHRARAVGVRQSADQVPERCPAPCR